jgi:hypothetical protein
MTLTALVRSEGKSLVVFVPWVLGIAGSAAILFRARDRSTPFLLIAPIVFFGVALAAGSLGDLRKMIAVTVALSVIEAAIVTAVSMVFGAFSTPFLTAACTVGVVLIGRNADLLAKLPEKTFGPTVVAGGRAIARVVPNLHLYVPPRVVLTGRAGTSVTAYVVEAAAYGVLYGALLLVASAVIFQRRDFA